LAYDLIGPAHDIHRLDVQKGIETQFISSTRHDANAQYSPDGSRIAFVSDQSGAFEIWICQGDGSDRQPLTSFRGPITDLPSWSPDGLRIAFHSRPEGTADIYVIEAEGGAPRRLTTEPSDDIAPTWSRDGRWIYFGSNRSGDHQIWRLPASGGVATQVTRNGGIFAQESHDGRFLFYTKTRGVAGLWKTLLSEGTAIGPESQVAGAVYYLNFAVRPEGVYFSPGGPIQFLPFNGGPVVSFGAKTAGALLSVSPDRKFFLYSVSRSTSDLMLVENFR
jgi:Tol biopolymer transport system component